MNGISILVPVWNEANNITKLTNKITGILRDKKYRYEIIFIDDNSTDGTKRQIKKLSASKPVKYYLKKGTKGKAHSLIEGFEYAKFDLICMIDADLQYSPEYIPQMLEKIENGADMVLTNRQKYQAGLSRKIISRAFHTIFVRLLHSIPYDTQSGLKIFKKKILKDINLSPSNWTFDLELVLKTHKAGHKVESIDIVFDKRHTGESKINVFQSSLEIGLTALRLKFNTSRQKTPGQYSGHTDLAPSDSAITGVTGGQYLILLIFLLAATGGFIYNWHAALVTLVSVLSILYFSDLIFNFFLIYRSYFREREIKINNKSLTKINSGQWPTYTILCPLYKEWAVLPQFIKSITNLDYPKDKLQVMLLLEKDDKESINKISSVGLPYYFKTVIVPNSQPKTKPKALNYGLSKATGEYAVIYDAEDIPDPLQLKKAVMAFKKAKKNIICVQAKLNFYNPSQNVLTKMFTIEYALWFNLVLTGLQSIHAPIPLGGTSNHFKTQDLIRLKKWDPFNVTEDADLGMRLMKLGYRTALINSYTMEEANSLPLNWLKQRSRWIKGYMQTYFVHMRRPQDFVANKKIHHLLTFQLVIGAKILSMLINPFMWLLTISYFAARPVTGEFIQSLYLMPIFYMAVITMFIGNFLYMYYYMLGASKLNQWDLIPYALLTPLYWLGMSIAAAFALWEFAFRPHYWHKTQHGLHLSKIETGSGDLEKKSKPEFAAASA